MSLISPDDYFERLHRVQSLLDRDNIRIIETMKKEGPRNLQNISRASKIPYTTVYSRVTRLEREGLLTTSIHPNYSKIGLTQGNVYVTPFPGRELLAREALKLTNYWVKISRCIGETNGYFSIATVPTIHSKDFEEYLDQLVVRGVLRNARVTWLGESTSPLPNFEYYEPEKKAWKFAWKDWLAQVKRRERRSVAKQVKKTESTFDKRDLIILKELVKNAQVTLASLAKMLSITLPAAKYRFEGLVEKGLIQDYIISILPFAPDVSELSEIRLDFKDEITLRNVESALETLPFVLTWSQVKGLNALSVRVYIPRSEQYNLFSFLSELVKLNILTNYTYVQLDVTSMQAQTFSYEEYNDETGWKYDNRKYLDLVDNLVSNWPRREIEPAPVPVASTTPMR